METKKIALACFIGGILCCSVALLFSSSFWWLGLMAGIAGGYISFEFRQFYTTAWKIMKPAINKSAEMTGTLFKLIRLNINNPRYIVAVVIGIALFIIHFSTDFLGPSSLKSLNGFLSWVYAFILASSIAYAVINFLELAGTSFLTRFELYYPPTEANRKRIESNRQDWEMKRELRPLTFSNFIKVQLRGIFLIIRFFVWDLWKYLLKGIGLASKHLAIGIKKLFITIHSHKRLLCALDGTIGGGASYYLFNSNALGFPEQVMIVFFGGLLGAAFGVLNWEAVSKRMLHLDEVKAQ